MPSLSSRLLRAALKYSFVKRQPLNDHTLGKMRSKFLAHQRYFPKPLNTKIEPVKINSVKAEWISVGQPQSGRVILFAPGGGFVFNGAPIHRAMLARLAKMTRSRVLSIHHSLAPEHPFP